MRVRSAQLVLAVAAVVVAAEAAHGASCAAHVYLTFDTGNMRHAEQIAQILARTDVRATFFLANERTPHDNFALDPAWDPYWKARADEGHAFGSHTWRHGRLLDATADGRLRYRPQFGSDAGKTIALSPAQWCEELRQPAAAFRRATGRTLDALWRAPGGHTSAASLAAAQSCGFAHVHWAPAGFLGDELPSDRYPNRQLLERALQSIQDGDVLMAHLGIWSRKDPFAPMIEPLIEGLKSRGFCFRTLREHPQYRTAQVPMQLAVTGAASR